MEDPIDAVARDDADRWLRIAFSESAVGMALLDAEGRFLKVNRALCAMFGFSERELLGLPFQAVAHPDDIAVDAAQIQSLIDGNSNSYQVEKRYRTRSGSTRWGNLSVSAVTSEDGPVTHFVAQIVEITGAKQAESDRREADARLQALFRHSPVLLSMRGLDGRYLDANNRLAELLGTTPEQLVGRHASEFTESPAAADVASDDRLVWDTREPVTRDIFFDVEDGQRVYHALRFPVLDDRGEVEAIGTFAIEVTDIRAAERERRAIQERFRHAFEDAPVGMSITSADGHFLQANDALCAMLGYSRAEFLKLTVPDVNHPEELERRERSVNDVLAGAIDHFQVDDRLRRSDGSWIWVSRHTTALRGADSDSMQLLSHVVDLTARRRLEDELRHLADHDPLTGLLNRRGIETELERHIALVRRYGDRGALLILDLDRFKSVNDTHGHEEGDRLLIAVAQLLTSRLRTSDAIGRLGGDEFAILLPEADAVMAGTVAEEIVRAIEQSDALRTAAGAVQITASVGICALTHDVDTTRSALATADLAMYKAKQAGRNRIASHEVDAAARTG